MDVADSNDGAPRRIFMTKRIKFILFTLFFSPSLFLINYYQSINMKKDEYPDYVFWTLYLLVVVCLTIICRSIRQILFSVLCMSAVSVGLGYWLIEKNESIRYLYNLGIPTTFIGLSLLVHVIPLFVCLFRSNKKNVEKA
ncbi:hypothetical protein [Geobacillus thermoleovorans]|nr:hypothetical protein [Geobacillus thermoleovorans]